MADKDLHWIRDWDIISAAAADGLFIHSYYLQSTGAQLLGIRISYDYTAYKEHHYTHSNPHIYLTNKIHNNQNAIPKIKKFHGCAVKDNNYLPKLEWLKHSWITDRWGPHGLKISLFYLCSEEFCVPRSRGRTMTHWFNKTPLYFF